MTTQPNDCVWIGIGIDIPQNDPVFAELLRLNQQLKSSYNLDLTPPHINLYDITIPRSNLPIAEDIIQHIVDSTKVFPISLTEITYFAHGTIYVSCELNIELKTLEKDVVEAISPLKQACRTEDYWQPWRKYTQQQKLYLENYGNPHVLKAFTPHITIGYVKTEPNELKRITDELNSTFPPTQCTATQLSLAVQDGQNKTISRKVFELPR